MEKKNSPQSNARRNFIGTLATGAAALGLASVASPLLANPESKIIPATNMDADEWFAQVKGKHKIVFDCTKLLQGPLPFAWPKIFLMTNESTGTLATDCSVVMVLRHDSIPYALEDRIWAKYNFGEVYKATDPKTEKPLMRNPFWKPEPGDFKIPGVGEVQIAISDLQAVGVMFCVCNAALTVDSAAIAGEMKLDAAEVLADWKSALLPGIQIVPSGVWAVGRAQEHGCAYCMAV